MGQQNEPEPEEVKFVEEVEESDDLKQVPIADIYVDGSSMNITIDISRHDDLDDSELELNLREVVEYVYFLDKKYIFHISRYFLFGATRWNPWGGSFTRCERSSPRTQVRR